MNEKISIHNLYNDILKELPFTISGNASFENTIFQFLQKVAETPFLTENSQIKFVMGGFAKIKLNDLQYLFQRKWETKRLKSFFFYDYEDDNTELLLSIYSYCIKELTKNDNFSKNLTNIICDNNYNGVNFRVKLSKDVKKIKIIYNRRDHVLEAIIPLDFYNNKFNILELNENKHTLDFNVERNIINSYQYFRKEIKDSDYDLILKDMLNDYFLPYNFKNSCESLILNPQISDSIKKNVLNNNDADIKEIYYLFYVAGLLAYLTGCNIEYFTSVANTVGGCKYSLGSIAVGYKSENLCKETRSFFSIISNHIASNLASQILLDSSNMQKYIFKRKFQEQFINEFINFYNLGSKSLHCKENTGEKRTFFEREKSEKEINQIFGQGFLAYLKKIIENPIIDWGMYEGFHAGAVCCKNVNLFYEHYDIEDCNNLGLNIKKSDLDPSQTDTPIDKPIVNVFLPNLLIEVIKGDKRGYTKITTKTIDTRAVIEIDYKENVDIEKFINALENKTGGSFTEFIKTNYEAFRICGDLIIKDREHKFEISLKNDFKVYTDGVSENPNNASEIPNYVFIGNRNSIKATKKLTFEIHYNLF